MTDLDILTKLERTFLATLLNSQELVKLCIAHEVQAYYFQLAEYQVLYKVIKYTWEESKVLLQDDAFQSLLKRSTTTDSTTLVKTEMLYSEVKLITPHSSPQIILQEFLAAYKQRRFANALGKSSELASDKKIDEAMQVLSTQIADIGKELTRATTSAGFVGAEADEILFKLDDKEEHPEKYRGIMIGFQSFDMATQGLMKGTSTLIMGSMKSAKSVLAVNIAYNVALTGKRVYYHVNEGGKDMVHQRLISCATGLNYGSIREPLDENGKKRLTDEDKAKIGAYLHSPEAAKIYVDSTTPASSTPAYVDSRLTELEADGPMDLMIIDHLGLMKASGNNDKWLQLDQITQDLIGIIRKHQIPVIILCHVNRDGLKKKGKSFGFDDMGLSLEPLKHVDLIISWRIDGTVEQFEQTHQGRAFLTIKGARDSETKEISLEVNTNKMKIYEGQLLGH